MLTLVLAVNELAACCLASVVNSSAGILCVGCQATDSGTASLETLRASSNPLLCMDMCSP